MAELRAALEAVGFVDVKSYVQSGNLVLSSRASAQGVATKVNAVIKKRFGFDVVVVVRSHVRLAEVVRRNPLANVAVDPKGHLLTFASADSLPRSSSVWARRRVRARLSP